MGEYVVVYESWEILRVHIVKHLLERAGIEAKIFDEHISSLIPSPALNGAGFGTMKIAVYAADAERAREVVKDFLMQEKFYLEVYSPDDELPGE